MDSQALAICKVLALTDPKRDAPRDLFDLGVLVNAEVEDPSHLLSTQSAERLEQALEELWGKVESMGYARFRAEVAPYLPDMTADTFTAAVYEELQMTVAERVEFWVLKALDAKTSASAACAEFAPGEMP